MRKTKIVCTLGPSTDQSGVLREMILAGMNVARFNFSHGTHEEHKARLDTLKALREELDAPVAAMLERKYGRFETETHDLRVDTDAVSAEEAANEIRLLLNRGERDAQN